jgi:hypothetical protein
MNDRPNLATDERGAIGVLFALMIAPLVLLAGLAVDFARVQSARRQLQSAVDIAVLAAAGMTAAKDDERIALATSLFSENTRKTQWLDSQRVSETLLPIVKVSGDRITMAASGHVTATFARVGGWERIAVDARTSAQIVSSGRGWLVCLLALEPRDRGIWLNGGNSGSHVEADCGVHVNSSSYRGISGNNKGSLTSKSTCVAGDVDTSPTYSPAGLFSAGGSACNTCAA